LDEKKIKKRTNVKTLGKTGILEMTGGTDLREKKRRSKKSFKIKPSRNPTNRTSQEERPANTGDNSQKTNGAQEKKIVTHEA